MPQSATAQSRSNYGPERELVLPGPERELDLPAPERELVLPVILAF